MVRTMSLVRRLLMVAAAILVFGYLSATAYLYANQRALIFQSEGRDAPTGPGGIAIPGSERVTITTSDGEKLAGWYLAPQPGQPVFLYFHGNVGRLEQDTGRWRRIADHGAGVFAFSYRGYPGATGVPTEEGLYRDARAAYRWLESRHAHDAIVLHGLSLGTGVAARLATEVDAKALILEAPYTAVSDVAAERFPVLPIELLIEHTFKTRDIIDKVRMPVLIVHGTEDSVIPFAHGQRLYQLARGTKAFVEMKGSDHLTLVRDGLYPKIWEFLGGLEGQKAAHSL